MARKKSRLLTYTEAVPVLGLLSLFKRFPVLVAETIIKGCLEILFTLLPKRRQIIYTNLKLCFPEWTEQKRRLVAKQSIQHLARGITAFIHMEDALRETSLTHVDMEGTEHVEAALKKGKGLIAFNAHYGCWEMSSAATMKKYPKVAGIYRPLDNPVLDEAVRRIRCSSFGTLIPRRQALKQGLPWLRNNGILGIIVDQNFPAGGVYVDFFGRLAATTPIVSILSQRTGATVLPVHSKWVGDRLKIIWEAPLPPSTYTDPKEACADDTQRMTKVVERWISEDPTQWLWMHNRWKKRPDADSWVWDPTEAHSASTTKN
jgi:KDO2-lipid IV(A) lauroyltransferase